MSRSNTYSWAQQLCQAYSYATCQACIAAIRKCMLQYAVTYAFLCQLQQHKVIPQPCAHQACNTRGVLHYHVTWEPSNHQNNMNYHKQNQQHSSVLLKYITMPQTLRILQLPRMPNPGSFGTQIHALLLFAQCLASSCIWQHCSWEQHKKNVSLLKAPAMHPIQSCRIINSSHIGSVFGGVEALNICDHHQSTGIEWLQVRKHDKI
jgi:hypothetical protein